MTLIIPNRPHKQLLMNRSRRRISLSVATIYSLCIAAVVPFHNSVTADNLDQNTNIRSKSLHFSKLQRRYTAADTPSIDMSEFNDDTTIEEVEELMEDEPEDDDGDNGGEDDDEGNDDGSDDGVDEVPEAVVNGTNATANSTLPMTTNLVGDDGDEPETSTPVPVPEVVPQDAEPQIEPPVPVETQEVATNTSKISKNTPPIPPIVMANNTDGPTDVMDEPESPVLQTTPPTMAPQPMLQTTPPTMAPQLRPTLLPTESPTSKRIDDFDPQDKQTEAQDDDLFDEKTFHNKNRPVSSNGLLGLTSSVTVVLGTLAAICGMIFTAWQMSDNPDGLYAALCRLTITCLQLIFRVIMSPCRKCCGGGYWSHHHHHHHLAGTNGYHEPYGHLPVSTMDYGYKDPALELT